MIKKIEIYNTFGIKDLKIDFEIKNDRMKESDFSVENQIAKTQNKGYSLIPSIIAKNASGKTSLLRSVKYASNFINKDNFILHLTQVMKSILYKRISILSMEINEIDMPDESREYLTNDDSIIRELIQSIFREIIYEGQEHSSIVIYFENVKLILETSHNDIILKQCDVAKPLSMFKLLSQILKKAENILRNVTINETAKFLDKIIREEVDKYDFSINDHVIVHVEEIIKDQITKPVSSRRSLWNDMTLFIENYGYEAFKTFIKKLDPNVAKIEFDKTSMQVLFYHIDNGDYPIDQLKLSFGTIKMIRLFANAINVFKKGGILLIDEVENGLHLSLIKLLVGIFSDPAINKHNAQLLLTTHNPLLFERGIVMIQNVYMSDKGNFCQVEQLSKAKNEFDIFSFIKSKNYYNDLFWIQEDASHKSTLSTASIDLIIYKIVDGHKVN